MVWGTFGVFGDLWTWCAVSFKFIHFQLAWTNDCYPSFYLNSVSLNSYLANLTFDKKVLNYWLLRHFIGSSFLCHFFLPINPLRRPFLIFQAVAVKSDSYLISTCCLNKDQRGADGQIITPQCAIVMPHSGISELICREGLSSSASTKRGFLSFCAFIFGKFIW